MTAVRGDINDGYVALDDFSFRTNEEFCSIKPDNATPTTTTAPTPTPTPTPKPHNPLPNCDFESDTCGWELFGMAFHWERTDSKTLTEGGHDSPLNDHEGKFLYAEAKLGEEEETASLMSPIEMNRNEMNITACMFFYYSLYVRYQ